MPEDPIVAETRELRQQMMDDAGNSVDELFAYLQKEQERYRDRLVSLPARNADPMGVRNAK